MAVSNVQLNEYGANSAYARRKDVFDVTCDFATNKTGNFLKVFYAIPGLFQNLGYLPADHAGLNGFCTAAKNAVVEAAKTVKNIRRAEVTKFDVKVENDKVTLYRAEMKIAFEIER